MVKGVETFKDLWNASVNQGHLKGEGGAGVSNREKLHSSQSRLPKEKDMLLEEKARCSSRSNFNFSVECWVVCRFG